MELNRLQKLAGLPLTEATTKVLKLEPVETTKYDSSEEFETAYYSVTEANKHVMTVLTSPAFKAWMRDSASNYGFNMSEYTQLVELAKKFNKEVEALYDTLSSLD